jgi:integrase
MNLPDLIEQYITYRRSLGGCFRNSAAILRSFGRVLGPKAQVGAIRTAQVSAFLNGTGTVTRTWHTKYSALRGFFQYAVSRGHAAAVPLPAIVPKQPPPFVPYIYTAEELRRLLRAADAYRGRLSCLEPVTIRTILVLLYGAGLRLGEALNLNRADVDGKNALLTIRQTKFHKTRLVPFGPDLGRALAQYAARPVTRHSSPEAETPFFTTNRGLRVKKDTFEGVFRRVCNRAGIRRTDGASYQPRLHDLRHTFAVHRLTSWYRQGADVQRLLPQLSVYLGHVHLSGTQVYLSMTPELLAEANARFARYAGEEDGHA